MRVLLRNLLAVALLCWTAQNTALADGDDDTREGGLTGTGIVGEITALGSIFVNDLRIEFETGLPVASALGPKTARDLRPGDIVAVAVASRQGRWEAQAITQVHALIGPVSSRTDAQLTVLGVGVTAPGGLTQTIKAGDWVAVQGFWTRDGVKATRVTAISPRQNASLQGSYAAEATRPGQISIGTAPFDIDPLQHAQPGDILRVTGPVIGGKLRVNDIYVGLFGAPVEIVMAEGYISDVAPSGHYTVKGTGLSSYTDNQITDMPDTRVRVCGITGQMLHTLEDVSPNARRQLGRLGCDVR